jgi:ABC-type Na+ efflux pump permease subunit
MFLGLGGLLCLIGIIWLIVIAIQTGKSTGEKILWALVNLLCQPLGGIIFFIVKRQGMVPLILVIVGWLLTAYGYSAMMPDMMRQMR